MKQVKQMDKSRLLVKIIGIFALLGVATAANAVSITGGFGVDGGYSLNNGTDLSNTTSLNLLDVFGTDAGVGSGDLGNVNFFSTPGVANDTFDFPAVAISNLLQIEGWQLDISTSSITTQTVSFLDVSGSGVVSCVNTSLCGGTNFDPTAANWALTANSTGSTYSLSVTTVPVPAAVWLFGSGLLGLVGIARRKAA